MDGLNPGVKFMAILIVGLMLSFGFNVPANVGVFILSLAMALGTRSLPLGRYLGWLSAVIFCALGFFATGVVFAKGGGARPPSPGEFVALSVSDVETALQLSSRVLAYGALALSFSLTTRPSDFFHSLGQQFGVPPKFVYGMIAAYGFIPTIREEHFLVGAALRVRGVRAGPFSPARLLPMLVRAFRRSGAVAMAMESRGFNPEAPRGRAFEVPLGAQDIAFLVVFVGLVALGLAFL
jgi:energy-coupling factor transport system permease protein